ncbi:MAG TPA: UDP-N-acetylglucosamine 2-epimerase (non-hydrolyzing) [Lacunisphaera sp.]|jgi:UDP-N-acetylglucosamine 2-epimerase (non-hydrolysing)
MTKNVKLLIVAGARPNFMKVAPIIQAIAGFNQQLRGNDTVMEYRLVHTGQHYDAKMSDVFFRELGIPAPDVSLEVGSGSHAQQTANVMTRFEPVCEREKPDWILVVGDVNPSMACTLVGVKMGIKVAHVEAGLRSFDRTMPEEINRLVTDSIADLLLTPSVDGDEHLKSEGVSQDRIRLVGNIMIDSLVANLAKARESKLISELNLKPGGFVYVTLHRPSNVDHRESLRTIMSKFESLGVHFPVVFPMHPRTRKMLAEFGITHHEKGNVRIIEPVGYHDSLSLTENARFVLTDSGGLQEETTYFRTPCLTLRPNTERPVTITLGSNKLTSVERLDADIANVLAREPKFGTIPPLWDGKTAGRVLQSILEKS